MIGEITPLVKAAGRRVWLTTAVAHVIGATLSGAFLGLVLGAAAALAHRVTWGVPLELIGAAVLVACALREAGAGRWPMPSLGRQTPRWFRALFPPPWFGLLWGADLGQGWTTRILVTGYYGLIAWILLRGNVAEGVLLLGAYGFARALPVAVAGGFFERRRVDEINRLPFFRQPILQQVNGAALALVAGTLITG